MIEITKIPQRSDRKVTYQVTGDVLKVILNGVEEIFDFSGLEEGYAEEIIAEELPINPILSAVKIGDTINIEVINFYGEDEKYLFEVIDNGKN